MPTEDFTIADRTCGGAGNGPGRRAIAVTLQHPGDPEA